MTPLVKVAEIRQPHALPAYLQNSFSKIFVSMLVQLDSTVKPKSVDSKKIKKTIRIMWTESLTLSNYNTFDSYSYFFDCIVFFII